MIYTTDGGRASAIFHYPSSLSTRMRIIPTIKSITAEIVRFFQLMDFFVVFL